MEIIIYVKQCATFELKDILNLLINSGYSYIRNGFVLSVWRISSSISIDQQYSDIVNLLSDKNVNINIKTKRKKMKFKVNGKVLNRKQLRKQREAKYALRRDA